MRLLILVAAAALLSSCAYERSYSLEYAGKHGTVRGGVTLKPQGGQ